MTLMMSRDDVLDLDSIGVAFVQSLPSADSGKRAGSAYVLPRPDRA
jgi:hypothetical protein